MEVRILKPGCTRTLPSGAEQSYPVNWSGDVPDANARKWIAEGKAVSVGAQVRITSEDVVDDESKEAFDPATGEITGPEKHEGAGEGEEGSEGEEAFDPETGEILETEKQLEEFTVVELRAMAKERGIRNTSRMREAELIAAIQAHDANA